MAVKVYQAKTIRLLVAVMASYLFFESDQTQTLQLHTPQASFSY